ncbi:hypothetical protein [Streptomyces aureus]
MVDDEDPLREAVGFLEVLSGQQDPLADHVAPEDFGVARAGGSR